MKILSLFDGISCARVALERAGIPVEVYYASEIDKYATQISKKNYPDINNFGDITGFSFTEDRFGKWLWGAGSVLGDIDFDLLFGGSPCQDLSIAKKNRKGLSGERSGLFWEYVRILKEVKPKYFVLENVNSMPKEAKAIITEALGIEPIMINAALVSAQNRKRLFWTNIPNITLPEDRGILLKDILEENVEEKYNVKSVDFVKGGTDKKTDLDFLGGIRNKDWARDGKNYSRNFGQGDRVYSANGKSTTLSALGGGRGAKTGLYLINDRIRGITVNERGIRPHRGDKAKTGIGELGRIVFESAKTDAISTQHAPTMITNDSIIRKLTPIECERLQGLAEIEQSCIIRVCKGNQNNSVGVENQNPKSQLSVGSVEKDDSNESVKYAVRSSNINNLQTNKLVQPDVLINCEENKIEIYNQNKLIANVSGVELKNLHPHLKSIGDFAHLVVGLNTTVEKTTPFGEAELPQTSSLLVVKESGNNVVNIYGKEITQLAEDASKDLITLNKLLKSTTSDLFIQGNNEQTIQTLFSYVASVIVGYIPKEIQNQNILTFQIKSKVGYTFGISNTQRYKCLGNAFNVDVVAHILSFIPK